MYRATFRSTLQELWNDCDGFTFQQTNKRDSLINAGNMWPNQNQNLAQIQTFHRKIKQKM